MRAMQMVRGVIGMSLVGMATAWAEDLNNVKIFDRLFAVQRFDYFQDIRYENPAPNFPGEVALREVEGAHYYGSNRLLLSSEAMSDAGSYKNQVVETRFLTDAKTGRITGMVFSRVVVQSDPSAPPVGLGDPWDLAPAGVTINTSEFGAGAGGNLLVGQNEAAVRPFDLVTGALLDSPVGCTADLLRPCGFDVTAQNEEVEDLAFVPPANVWTIRELSPNTIEVFTTSGGYVESRPLNGPELGTPKGMTYLPDVPVYPRALQGLGGVVMVSYDNDGPGLQAHQVVGTTIINQSLTTDGTAFGPSLLALGVCPNALQIESLATDPATGRFFLVNEGSGPDCNYVFVLTPYAYGDMNCDGAVDFDDINGFVVALVGEAAYAAQFPTCDHDLADVDGVGGVNFDDIGGFIAALIGG